MITLGSVMGNSGIVNPNGKNKQFTKDQTEAIVVAGPSAIVTKSG